MASFIELHTDQNEKCLINLDKVLLIANTKRGARVYFCDESDQLLRESFSSIVNLLGERKEIVCIRESFDD